MMPEECMELNVFEKHVDEKYLDAEPTSSWDVTIDAPSKEEEQENRTMVLLFMDRKPYGWNKNE